MQGRSLAHSTDDLSGHYTNVPQQPSLKAINTLPYSQAVGKQSSRQAWRAIGFEEQARLDLSVREKKHREFAAPSEAWGNIYRPFYCLAKAETNRRPDDVVAAEYKRILQLSCLSSLFVLSCVHGFGLGEAGGTADKAS